MDRYPNKRTRLRSRGKFRKATPADVGIAGVCPACRHFLLSYYDGDPGDPFPDPRKFRARCFTCEPETTEERTRREAYEASRPKPPTLESMFRNLADRK